MVRKYSWKLPNHKSPCERFVELANRLREHHPAIATDIMDIVYQWCRESYVNHLLEQEEDRVQRTQTQHRGSHSR